MQCKFAAFSFCRRTGVQPINAYQKAAKKHRLASKSIGITVIKMLLSTQQLLIF